jgi:hypothetical protein
VEIRAGVSPAHFVIPDPKRLLSHSTPTPLVLPNQLHIASAQLSFLERLDISPFSEEETRYSSLQYTIGT